MKIRYWLVLAAGGVLVACASSPAMHEGVPASAPSTSETTASTPAQPAPPPPTPGTRTASPPPPVTEPAPVQAPPAQAPEPARKPPSPAPAAAEKPAAKPAAAPATPATGTVFGHVDIAGSTADEIAQTVIYFVPDAGAPAPKPGEYRVYTHRRAFDPPSLAIPLGSKIIFPNQDDILHNVFSATPGSEFDLGTYAEDERASYTFRKAGVVTVNCNVHQEMQASILVLATPYFANAGANGDFRIADLPAGPGKLSVWHPRAQTQMRALSVPSLEPLALQLVLSKPAVSAHLNKERKQYRPRAQP